MFHLILSAFNINQYTCIDQLVVHFILDFMVSFSCQHYFLSFNINMEKQYERIVIFQLVHRSSDPVVFISLQKHVSLKKIYISVLTCALTCLTLMLLVAKSANTK